MNLAVAQTHCKGNLHIVVQRKISWSGQWKVVLFQIPKRTFVSALEII